MINLSNQTDVDSNSSLKHKAYQYIKGKITSRSIAPGQYISDKTIAEELNISTTPVRLALYLLEHEGLLVNERRKGWRVFSLTLADIQQIFEIKIPIEGMLVHKTARIISENDATRLGDVFSNMEIAGINRDYSSWLKSDILFHDILYTCAENPRAHRLINGLNDQWNRVWVGLIAMEGRMSKAVEEHRAIFLAVRDHKPDEAEQNLRFHLSELQAEVEHILKEIIFPFTDNEV